LCLIYISISRSPIRALEEHGPIAGTASALMGAMQFAVGAAVMAVVDLSSSTARACPW
jgi:DHA1 family bicyclomycin/chloramphenicol resistance-like MFS transporter